MTTKNTYNALLIVMVCLVFTSAGTVMAYDCSCEARSYSTAPEILTIPSLNASNGSQCIPDPVSSFPLAYGKCYKVQANGTYIFGTGLTGDAEWQLRTSSPLFPSWQKYGGSAQVEPTPPILDWGDLLINNMSVDWGNFSDSHVYSVYLTGTGTPINFRIADSGAGGTINDLGSYCDNSGSLTVKLYVADPVPMEIPLYAGKDDLCEYSIGHVLVWHDCDNIYVTYVIDDSDWYIIETHFDIVTDPANFPMTKPGKGETYGNPQVGLFSYGETGLWIQVRPYTIDLDTLGIDPCSEDVYIAVHAAVKNPGDIITAAPYPATVVESSTQGLRKEGSPVLSERSTPSNGLINDYTGSTVTFYSLGFGGNITVSFDCPVVNGLGNDIVIYEVTNGVYPPENVTVEASQDGIAWVNLGTGTNGRTTPRSSGSMITASYFDLNSLSSAKYIRITDTSNPSLFESTADAFDLDGIYSLKDCVGVDTYETAWGSTCDAATDHFVQKGNWATYFEFTDPCEDFCPCSEA